MTNEKAALSGAALSESAPAKVPNLVAQNSAPLTHVDLNRLLRDEKLRATYDSVDKWHRWAWEQTIQFLARGDQPFTSDDCRAAGAPDTTHPNHVGAVMFAMSRAGWIEPVGFVQSSRRQRHAAWLRQWVGAR